MKKLNILYTFIFIGFISFSSCTTDSLEPTLAQEKSVEGSIVDVENLYGIIKGSYNFLTSSGYYGRDLIATNEVRSNNCFSNGNSGRFTTQASFVYSATTGYFWDEAYEAIASTNIIIGTDVSTLTGDQAYGSHLQGQAYALRALVHFDLLKQYGQMHTGGTLGVPIITEFKGEDLYPSRNSISEVKAQILSDLNTAFNLMSDDFYDDSREFMSKYSAKALESRVAVYFGDWELAKSASLAVINSGLYSIVGANEYVASFGQDGSANSIFELAFSASDNAGNGSISYIYKTWGTGSYGDVQVLDDIIDLYDDADARKGILGYEEVTKLRCLGKYPDLNGNNNYPIIRFEEMILNYAEALLETGGDALTQLNLLVTERGLPPYATVNKADILFQRRLEFMFEGYRFDDLMRTGSDIVKYSLQQNFANTIPYGDPILAWAIPQVEMDANSNMEQNAGY